MRHVPADVTGMKVVVLLMYVLENLVKYWQLLDAVVRIQDESVNREGHIDCERHDQIVLFHSY